MTEQDEHKAKMERLKASVETDNSSAAPVPKGRLDYACALRDARGESKGSDGLVMGNVLALYTHMHFASQPQMAGALATAARRAGMPPSVSSGGMR